MRDALSLSVGVKNNHFSLAGVSIQSGVIYFSGGLKGSNEGDLLPRDLLHFSKFILDHLRNNLHPRPLSPHALLSFVTKVSP